MFQIYKFLSRMECGKIRTLAAFLTEYFVLLKFDDHTRFRLKFPLHYSGKNRWQSLVPHFKESVGSYTASTYKSSSFNFNELQFPWQIIGKIYWWMSRRLYSDITVQSQYIDNWQLKRCSSEIGHTVKIQPRYSGSPQPSGVGRDLCSGSRD